LRTNINKPPHLGGGNSIVILTVQTIFYIKRTFLDCLLGFFIMKKKITFFILGNTGFIIKKTTVSRGVITCLTIFIAVCLILFSIVIYDYLKQKEEIVSQQGEIVNQRKQLKAFAADINSLKSKLVDLKDFEKKIRNVADIEENAEQENPFGVGGSIPEDFEIPVTEEYNSLIREMHEQTQQFNLAAINQKKSFESLFNNLEEQRNLLAATPAIRPTDGWIGTKGLMGKLIVIDHGYGMVTRYAHIHKMLKKRGDAVKKGDVIALVGNTGRSTGSHLHYEVHLDGIAVNPAKYILN